MGYHLHHAIIVSTWSAERLRLIHAKVLEIAGGHDFAGLVSAISETGMNGYCSFCIFPDGSKEGWDHSNRGDEFREAVKRMLIAGAAEGMWSSWVEVAFAGDDPDETAVIDHSGKYDDDDDDLPPEFPNAPMIGGQK